MKIYNISSHTDIVSTNKCTNNNKKAIVQNQPNKVDSYLDKTGLYFAGVQNIHFGSPNFLKNNFYVDYDKDRNEVLVNIKAENNQAEAVIEDYKLVSGSTRMSKKPLTVLKNNDGSIIPQRQLNTNGEFVFRFPALDKGINEYAKELKILKISFLDKNGDVTKSLKNEEIPVGLATIDIKRGFLSEAQKKISVDGQVLSGSASTLGNDAKYLNPNFSNVAPGVAQGRLVVVSNPSDYEKDVKSYHGDEPRVIYLKDYNSFNEHFMSEGEDFYLPRNIKGIIIKQDVISANSENVLGHLTSRLRNRQVVGFTNAGLAENIESFIASKKPSFVEFESNQTNFKFNSIPSINLYKYNSIGSKDIGLKLIPKPLAHNQADFTPETVGLKAYNLGKLTRLSQAMGGEFTVPQFFVVPAGVIDKIKRDEENKEFYKVGKYYVDSQTNALIDRKNIKDSDLKIKVRRGEIKEKLSYHALVSEVQADVKVGKEPHEYLTKLRELIQKEMIIPKEVEKDITSQFKKTFNKKDNEKLPLGGNTPEDNSNIYMYDKLNPEVQLLAKTVKNSNTIPQKCYIARSSFNGEDSDKMPTQGLYDSVAGIRTQKELMDGVKKVWASKWKDLSFWARHDYKIGHEKIQPNIIIQEVMPVDYTFTLYTGNLEKNSKDKMTIQLSPGVDCGFAGDPYIFEYDRTANSQSYPAMRTMMATKNRMKNISKVLMNDPYREKYDSVDYSKDPLNCSKKEYSSLIEKIAKIAERIEEEVPTEIMEKNSKGKWVKVKKSVPQDIEGGVKFVRKNGKMVPEIYIWQTRNIFYPDETAKKQ